MGGAIPSSRNVQCWDEALGLARKHHDILLEAMTTKCMGGVAKQFGMLMKLGMAWSKKKHSCSRGSAWRRHARALGKLSKGWMVAGAIAGTGFLPSGSCYSPANLAICPSKAYLPGWLWPLHSAQCCMVPGHHLQTERVLDADKATHEPLVMISHNDAGMWPHLAYEMSA
ncbi:hypothetical protein WJX77_005643 [Trebouxia sp. C0004]